MGNDAYILLLFGELCSPSGHSFHPLSKLLPLSNELCCDTIDFNLFLENQGFLQGVCISLQNLAGGLKSELAYQGSTQEMPMGLALKNTKKLHAVLLLVFKF